MYGFFPGGDPRKFEPDTELNTPEEIASWKTACLAWNEGRQKVQPGGCVVMPDGVILNISNFGLGVYEYDEDELDDEATS